jgi:citrate synthase
MSSDASKIRARGYDIAELMRKATFTDVVFLLHQARLPSDGERRLLNAVLISVADHNSAAPSCAAARLVASGNRQSISAAVAAGILAVGNEHGGAGELCMEMIAAAAEYKRKDSLTVEAAATRVVEEFRAAGRRVPGLGHRVHAIDPRTQVMFDLATEEGVAGDGVALMRAIEASLAKSVKPLPINVDGALAAVFFDLGFPSAAGKLLFLVGRVAGLTAEVGEEYQREKPMRVRFQVEYDGIPPREME